MSQPSDQILAQLRALVLDCDGVLTCGGLFFDEAGRRLLRFDSKDGLAIAMLCRANFPVGILSGRPVDVARARHAQLGVSAFMGECRDKQRGLTMLCTQLQVSPRLCAFMGDDLPDLPGFAAAGLRLAPQDAAPEVLRAADWVTSKPGGRGAVREVCEAIARSQGIWQRFMAHLPPLGASALGQP